MGRLPPARHLVEQHRLAVVDLVLYRLPAAVERTLRRALAGTGADLLIVPTLDDAAALA